MQIKPFLRFQPPSPITKFNSEKRREGLTEKSREERRRKDKAVEL